MREILILVIVLLVVHNVLATRSVMEFDVPRSTPEEWELVGPSAPSALLRLTFAVRQRNLDRLEDLFWAVSTPGSGSYGRHLTKAQVDKLIAPNQNHVDSVLRFLDSSAETISATDAGEFIVAEMRVSKAEELLNCTFHDYRQVSTGQRLRRTKQYSLPAAIAAAVDFVGGTIRFPGTPRVVQHTASNDQITPTLLRQRYNITDMGGHAAGNQQAVAAFLDQYFSEQDLAQFFTKFFPEGAQKVAKITGPNDQKNPGVEASLDIQYIMATGAKIPTWFISTKGLYDDQEPFLDWIVAVCRDANTPKVHSISYGDIESSLSTAYTSRINVEFMKAGVRGISILFASGDSGVGSGCTKFVPNFPVSSPYVTGVGATSINGADERTASFSGGGFSNYFAQPAYQKKAVAQYMKVAKDLPPPSVFNISGRAYPDVAAVGVNYVIEVNGREIPGVGGTSCSAPAFAGLVALINDRRMVAGKSPMGFLNPWLYQIGTKPYAFLDITEGNNPGCGTLGFSAAPGWDPTTGFGAPNYPELLQLAMQAV